MYSALHLSNVHRGVFKTVQQFNIQVTEAALTSEERMMLGGDDSG